MRLRFGCSGNGRSAFASFSPRVRVILPGTVFDGPKGACYGFGIDGCGGRSFKIVKGIVGSRSARVFREILK